MKKDQYWSKPKKARTDKGEAWWYANDGYIELIVSGADRVYLRRSDLKRYVARTAR